MKYFCFRFDVDTHKCLRDGVPNLLKLADEMDVKFTFFVNFGKTLDYSLFIKNKLKPKQGTISNSLPAHKKLGIKDSLYILLQNPRIGISYPRVLKQIIKSGHELGLHGGSNHETWLRSADTWSLEKTKAEVLWGLEEFRKYNKEESGWGFASPGFTTSKNINLVLSELGFSYIADIYSDKPIEKIFKKNNLKFIPTNILGNPGGVGYIEFCKALKMTDSEILSDFKKKLKQRKKLAVVYDHPYYSGIQQLHLIKEMLNTAKNEGFKIVTLKEMSKFL